MRKTRIAVVDSGISNINEKVFSKVVDNYMYDKAKHTLKKIEESKDLNGHGTLCASTIIKECPDVEIINIKLLDDKGICSLSDIESVLENILFLDVDIVNLSLALEDNADIKKIKFLCEENRKQNRIIVSSVRNGYRKSYPAAFHGCIGVRGNILKSENDLWFNKRKKIQCVVDSTPYLHPINKDNYVLWGKSNSYAAARVTGIISREIENSDFSVENVISKLEEIRTKKNWNEFMLKKSLRRPDIYQYKDLCDSTLINDVEKYASTYLKNDHIRNVRLLSNEGGLSYDECYIFLKALQKYFSIEIEDYTEISREVFYSIYSICYYIEKKMKENAERDKKISKSNI